MHIYTICILPLFPGLNAYKATIFCGSSDRPAPLQFDPSSPHSVSSSAVFTGLTAQIVRVGKGSNKKNKKKAAKAEEIRLNFPIDIELLHSIAHENIFTPPEIPFSPLITEQVVELSL